MLLAKGAIESLNGGAGFYLNVFLLPECTGGLQPIVHLKQFNHHMYIPMFFLFSSRMPICIFTFVK